MIQIHVKLFALLRDRAGVSEVTLELPDRSTVAAAVEQLMRQVPAVRDLMRSVAYAVNRSYTSADTILNDGDELAVIPPVSGG